MSYKRLGDYIEIVDDRNKDLAVTNLLGINISKNYMPSVANKSGLDLSKYKVLRKGQFATNLMHVNKIYIIVNNGVFRQSDGSCKWIAGI